MLEVIRITHGEPKIQRPKWGDWAGGGGRLMKAMMCEANRKEDRMCGKQMERRQPSGKGHNAQLNGSV